jgi:hypothetical protein
MWRTGEAMRDWAQQRYYPCLQALFPTLMPRSKFRDGRLGNFLERYSTLACIPVHLPLNA